MLDEHKQRGEKKSLSQKAGKLIHPSSRSFPAGNPFYWTGTKRWFAVLRWEWFEIVFLRFLFIF